MNEPDRSGDRPAVGSAGSVWLLNHCNLVKKGLPSVCDVKLQAIIELHVKIHYPFNDSNVMLVWWHATFYLILIVMICVVYEIRICKNLFWNLLIYLIVMTKMFVLHMPLF